MFSYFEQRLDPFQVPRYGRSQLLPAGVLSAVSNETVGPALRLRSFSPSSSCLTLGRSVLVLDRIFEGTYAKLLRRASCKRHAKL